MQNNCIPVHIAKLIKGRGSRRPISNWSRIQIENWYPHHLQVALPLRGSQAVSSFNLQGEQFHWSNQVKHGKTTTFRRSSWHCTQWTAASTWWCGPRPRLGWVEMAVGLPEGPSYPGHSPSIFRYAAPWTTAERQHAASTKSVACFHFFFSPALLLPFFVSSFFSSWLAVTFTQPWPHLSLLCVRWKCDLAGQICAMLHLLQMGPSKVLTTFSLRIPSSGHLSLVELPPLP